MINAGTDRNYKVFPGLENFGTPTSPTKVTPLSALDTNPGSKTISGALKFQICPFFASQAGFFICVL